MLKVDIFLHLCWHHILFSSLPIANIECYQNLIEAVSHRFPRIPFFKFLYTKLSGRLQNINPPWEDKNVDRVANKTKDWHQDHQDADHFWELKCEKLMPLCPGLQSSQHFFCSGTKQTMWTNQWEPPCVCVSGWSIWFISTTRRLSKNEWVASTKKRKKGESYFSI